MVLGAADGLHTLAVTRISCIDVVTDRSGTDEADRSHLRMLKQRIHRDLVALHDVEHAVRQACLAEQVGDEQSRAGVGGAGLEHEGIAAGELDHVDAARHFTLRIGEYLAVLGSVRPKATSWTSSPP